MDNLKKIKDIVEDILENTPSARNSDYNLYCYVIARMNPEAMKLNVIDFLIKRKELGLPNIESVGRARRKIVENRPELAGTDDVEAQRMLNEETFREFAKVAY